MWETIKWFTSKLWVGGKLDLSDGVWERLVEEMNNEKPNLSVIDIYTQKMFRGGLVSFEEFELLYNMGDDISGESRISIMRKFKKSYSRLEFRNGRFGIKKLNAFNYRKKFYWAAAAIFFLAGFPVYYFLLDKVIRCINYCTTPTFILSLFLLLLVSIVCCFTLIVWSILDEEDSMEYAKEIIARQELYFSNKNKHNNAKPLNTESFGCLFFVFGCFLLAQLCPKNCSRDHFYKN